MSNAGTESRLAAHAMLMAVLKQSQTLEVAMIPVATGSLSPADKALAYRLAKTVLRYKLAFDKLLKGYLSTALKDSRLDITCCLYIGVAQILLLETPVHAAVNTTVEVAKKCFPQLSGLVNAVCKKIAADKDKITFSPKDATPEWLWKSWVKAYGEDKAMAMAAVHLTEPPLDVNWLDPLEQGEKLPTGAVRLPRGIDFSSLPGRGWAQDAAAVLPVQMLGDMTGLEVLDACAAPGGKTMQLAAAGAKVTAVDISEARLKRLRENLQRTGLQAKVVCADVKKWQAPQKYDVVVLDSPCSATGTLRRHPEILHQRTPQDVARLVIIQRQMLQKALSWLKPGGRLLYVTCSLQPEEGEGQMAAFKSKVVPFAGSEEWITPQGYLRTLPSMLADKGGMDGFFAAVLS